MSLDDLYNDNYMAQQDVVQFAVEFPAAYAMAFQEQVEEFFEHLVRFKILFSLLLFPTEQYSCLFILGGLQLNKRC